MVHSHLAHGILGVHRTGSIVIRGWATFLRHLPLPAPEGRDQLSAGHRKVLSSSHYSRDYKLWKPRNLGPRRAFRAPAFRRIGAGSARVMVRPAQTTESARMPEAVVRLIAWVGMSRHAPYDVACCGKTFRRIGRVDDAQGVCGQDLASLQLKARGVCRIEASLTHP
jgi:hypothetical protein